MFEFQFNVYGLEELDKYSWILELDGKEVARAASSNIAKFKVPDDAVGKMLKVHTFYGDQPFTRTFMVFPDSSVRDAKDLKTSDYDITVSRPSTKISGASFENRGEYVIGQEFRFQAYKCGRCVLPNLRPIPRNELRVEVEADGRDLLDNFVATDVSNPFNGAQTTVRFTLRGKVSRDGTDATIHIRCGELDKTYNITLFPPED
jgi:hypothetical protein